LLRKRCLELTSRQFTVLHLASYVHKVDLSKRFKCSSNHCSESLVSYLSMTF
jgi:hypothetical protein